VLSKATLTGQAAASIKNGYAWVFSGQIREWEGEPQPGDLVELVGPDGERLGYAYANPKTTLALRLLYSPEAGRRGGGEPDEPSELARKLDRAWSRRRGLALNTNAMRLVWSEADGLPGVVCDSFGDILVVQFFTVGAERRREWVLEWLASRLKPQGIYERSLGASRAKEGLPPRSGWVWTAPGRPEPEPKVMIEEGPLRFQVDVAAGQKTGFYLDQRAARRLLQSQALAGAAVLDCFSYSGGFALSAALAGASQVTAVDSSARALAALEANARLNALEDKIKTVRGKVFNFLVQAVERGEAYQLVILDPPAFARNRTQRARALAGYRELHRRAAQLLSPGGLLLTCSCSHVISRRDLRASALAGARDAGRILKVRSEFGPDADHPEKSQVPESRYLTCMFARMG